MATTACVRKHWGEKKTVSGWEFEGIMNYELADDGDTMIYLFCSMCRVYFRYLIVPSLIWMMWAEPTVLEDTPTLNQLLVQLVLLNRRIKYKSAYIYIFISNLCGSRFSAGLHRTKSTHNANYCLSSAKTRALYAGKYGKSFR